MALDDLSQSEATAAYALLRVRIAQKARIEQAQLSTLTIAQVASMFTGVTPTDLKNHGVEILSIIEGIIKPNIQNSVALASGAYDDFSALYIAEGTSRNVKKFSKPVEEVVNAIQSPVLVKGARTANFMLKEFRQERINQSQFASSIKENCRNILFDANREAVKQIALGDRNTFNIPNSRIERLVYSPERLYLTANELDDEYTDEFSEYLGNQENGGFMESSKRNPTQTDVRSGGCDFCKMMALYSMQNKLHKNCTCIEVPNFIDDGLDLPPTLSRFESIVDEAKDRVAASGDSFVDRNIMREIRKIRKENEKK